jgi:hypothetical protein
VLHATLFWLLLPQKHSHFALSLLICGRIERRGYRYSQYGGNNGVSVPITGSVAGIPATGVALNSQKATQFVSTELVWRFNWFGSK